MSADKGSSNPNMDMEAHEETYHSFIRFAQIGTAVVVAILAGMALFLV